MLNANFEAQILEQTYFDKCDIIREVKVKDTNTGTTQLEQQIIYEGIKCSLSAKESTRETLEGEIPSIVILNKLFLHPRYEIELGDTIEITLFNGKKDVYLASKPFFYPSHTEIPVKLKERS